MAQALAGSNSGSCSAGHVQHAAWHPQTLASISGRDRQYSSHIGREPTSAHSIRAFAEMPAERMSVKWTMLPKLLDLPFCDFTYFVEVGVKTIPSACIGIRRDPSPLGLQVIIQVIP